MNPLRALAVPKAASRGFRGLVPALGFCALALACFAAPARAQPSEQPDPGDLVNYAYALNSGFGGFSLSGRSVQVYKIPFSFKIRSLEEHPLGVRLTLPVSFGVHDLKAIVDDEARPLERLRTVTFVPGVEFQQPLGSRTVLKPFAEAGFGRETQASGATVYLYSVGVKTLTTLRAEGPRVRFGTKADWNGVSGERGRSDDYGVIELGVESVYPLPASLGGRRLDLGPYVIVRHFVPDLVFERVGAPAVEIDDQVELGLSIGTEEAIRFIGIKLPRFGIAYRFGDGLSSWQINFGFPF